jgi:hypothetical protein
LKRGTIEAVASAVVLGLGGHIGDGGRCLCLSLRLCSYDDLSDAIATIVAIASTTS